MYCVWNPQTALPRPYEKLRPVPSANHPAARFVSESGRRCGEGGQVSRVFALLSPPAAAAVAGRDKTDTWMVPVSPF